VSRAGRIAWGGLAGRLAVAVLLGLALWNPAWRLVLSPVNAVVVLDESGSIGEERPAAAWQAAATALAGLPGGSRYSLVRFGLEPVLEASDRPTTELGGRQERPRQGALNSTGTDIEAALRMAGRRLAGEEPGVVLLVTDGGETRGDATGLLAEFRAMGLAAPFLLIDAPDASGPDAAITALDAPSQVPLGAEVAVALEITSTRDGRADVTVRQASAPASTFGVDLASGQVSRIRVPLEFDTPGSQELEFAVSLAGDENPANDRRRAIVNVEGRTAIFYVTGQPTTAVANSLLAGGWNVETIRPQHFPQRLPDLPEPATVVLDDVAVGDMPDTAWLALTESVRTRGTGLVVLGGQRSFGAGDYLGSTLEAALPVTAEAGQATSPAAVLFVVDTSGSMGRGPAGATPLGLAKTAVLAASRLLGEHDYSGITAFDVAPEIWLPLADRDDPAAAAMEAWKGAPSGGTRIAPALVSAAGQLGAAEVSQRLLLLVTDGFAVEDDYSEALALLGEYAIDVIALAIGDEPAIDVLEKLTSLNDGLLLRVSDVATLPRLASEAIGARRLTFDSRVTRPRELRQVPFLAEGEVTWPDLQGYMVTKARPAARVYLGSDRGDPLLADHDFGLGRVVAVPGGLGVWAPGWPDWARWAEFTGGLAEWAGNRFGGDRVFVRVDGEGGRPEIEIDAVSAEGDWAVGDAARIRLSDPFGRHSLLQAEAVAPGSFRAELPLRQTGHYRASLQVGSLSKNHDFHYEAPAELNSDAAGRRAVADWLDQGLVRPWSAADPMRELHAATARPTRKLFVALAALLYLGILIVRYAGDLRTWRHRTA